MKTELPTDQNVSSVSDDYEHVTAQHFQTEMIQRRREILLHVMLVLAFFEVVFLAKALIDGVVFRQVSLSVSLLMIALSYLFVVKGSIEFGLNLLCGSVVLVTTAAVMMNGGIYTPAAGWLLIAAPIAGLVGGVRVCKILVCSCGMYCFTHGCTGYYRIQLARFDSSQLSYGSKALPCCWGCYCNASVGAVCSKNNRTVG